MIKGGKVTNRNTAEFRISRTGHYVPHEAMRKCLLHTEQLGTGRATRASRLRISDACLLGRVPERMEPMQATSTTPAKQPSAPSKSTLPEKEPTTKRSRSFRGRQVQMGRLVGRTWSRIRPQSGTG